MRSKLIYQKAIGGRFEFAAFLGPDPQVPLIGWRKLRTGQICVFMEYLKYGRLCFRPLIFLYC